jgi:cell division protein FtsW
LGPTADPAMRTPDLDLPDPDAPAPRGAGLGPVGVILLCACALAVLGLVAVYSATAFRSPTFFFKQVAGLFLAAGAGFVVSRLDLENWRRHVWILGALVVGALLLVAIPGVGISVNGSRRWLGLGPARFQVSELAKLGLVFVLAHYLALNQSRMADLKRGFLAPLGLIGAFAGLNMLQPDYGTTALIAAVGLVLLFLAGARWRYILVSVSGMIAFFTVAVMLNQNRLARFLGFLDVEGNKQGETYQLYQAILAFASGGVEGVGIGQGRQQMSYLPEAHTDFIFAIVGEELGLFATLGTVALFLTIFVCGLLHLRRAPNQFQYLLVAGCLLLISLQAIVNLGVVTGRLPTKGMSLPFVSAGMSNLLLMGVLVGILVNTRRAWCREQVLPGSRDFLG